MKYLEILDYTAIKILALLRLGYIRFFYNNMENRRRYEFLITNGCIVSQLLCSGFKTEIYDDDDGDACGQNIKIRSKSKI